MKGGVLVTKKKDFFYQFHFLFLPFPIMMKNGRERRRKKEERTEKKEERRKEGEAD